MVLVSSLTSVMFFLHKPHFQFLYHFYFIFPFHVQVAALCNVELIESITYH